ncbi:MAG: hypothetical protein ACQEXJ_22515 [Myxococcota bacterium]
MNVPSPVLHALLAAMLLVVSGCESQAPVPSPERDLRTRPADGEAPTIPMTVERLESQADFDALEERYLARTGADRLASVLEVLAADADPTARERDALLLQRLALLHLRSGEGSGRLTEAFEVADRLREEAPDQAHTLYLLGHIADLILPQDGSGAYDLGPTHLDVAERCREHWSRLLEVAPEYTGPLGRSAEDVRADLEHLRAALSTVDEEEAPDTPPAPGREAPRSVSEARRVLHGLETGSRGQRLTLCRDWLESVGEAEPKTHAGRWVLLRCGVELNLTSLHDRAARALADLVRAGALDDPCHWMEPLGPADHERLLPVREAMEARDLPPCPAP